jgi:hypothetical protein
MVLSPRHYGRRSGSRAATSRRTGAGSVAQRQDPRRRLWVATVGGPVASVAVCVLGAETGSRRAGDWARALAPFGHVCVRTGPVGPNGWTSPKTSLEWSKSYAEAGSPALE